ncbi:hypothetical protein SADUNF_Sadunf03G0103300 [Salix dunnii]|uniref:Mitochondrial carrier protein n=1 Tax=Salix dunnii TaxID=1413687 RepID=A0A835K861_9ROSI|nr:hypothetical protein SADUNF_Sadunf03G0103300 [Salix dunnii]
MFKGNDTNCARIVPNSAVKFFSYEEASERQTGKDDAQLTPLLRLGAGACAGIIAMSATYPMDMVRGRLTVQIVHMNTCRDKTPRQYRGIAHALSTVLNDEGPRALYKGWVPSVIGVIPKFSPALEFAFPSLVEDNELGVATRLACGAAAGTVGQTVAYPLDGKAALEYTVMADAFRKTVRHEGFGVLYKGLVPNSVKVIPSIAIAFVTYEMVMVVLGVEMRISD